MIEVSELVFEIGNLLKKIQRNKGNVEVIEQTGFGGKLFAEDYAMNLDGKEIQYSQYYNQLWVDDDVIEDFDELTEIAKKLRELVK